MTIRLQAGAKPAKGLRELSGYLAAQVFLPNTPLVVVDNVFKAKGKSVHIKGGGRLVVDRIDQIEAPAATSYAKNASGDRLDGNGKIVVSAGSRIEYRIVCKLDGVDNSTAVVRNGRVVNVNSGPLGGDCIPELRDANGHRLTITGAPEQSTENDAQGQVVRTVLTMQFPREAGQGEPARLLLIGTAVPTIHVPFRFENVPLR